MAANEVKGIDFSNLDITIDDTPIETILADEPDFDASIYNEEKPLQLKYAGKDIDNRCVKLEIL